MWNLWLCVQTLGKVEPFSDLQKSFIHFEEANKTSTKYISSSGHFMCLVPPYAIEKQLPASWDLVISDTGDLNW